MFGNTCNLDSKASLSLKIALSVKKILTVDKNKGFLKRFSVEIQQVQVPKKNIKNIKFQLYWLAKISNIEFSKHCWNTNVY